MHIAIIGSAGRERPTKWTKDVYVRAFKHLQTILESIPVEERRLYSGGAAWADHLAVSLYLKDMAHSLTIATPCFFAMHEGDHTSGPKPGFYDDKSRGLQNPGGILNYYHSLFSEKMGANTLDGLRRAFEKGAIEDSSCHYKTGCRLKARNTQVARSCDLLIAFTWGDGDMPGSSGTLDTWNKFGSGKKIHVPLGQL